MGPGEIIAAAALAHPLAEVFDYPENGSSCYAVSWILRLDQLS
jgi:hypothetical protein